MRKSGFFPRLALVNLMRNGRFYGPYLLSCGMTAAMYYILSYLTFSDIVSSFRAVSCSGGTSSRDWTTSTS